MYWINKGWQNVFIGYCPDKKSWKKQMKKFKVKEPYPTSDGRCSIFEKDGKVSCIITFRAIETHSKIAAIGLIVHEVLHVWQEVLLNMQESKPSPEFESYSVMAITQNILEEMERAGKFKL